MATLTDDSKVKALVQKNEAIFSMESHFRDLLKEAKLAQNKEAKRLIEETLMRVKREAPFLNTADLKALSAHLTEETDAAVKKIAGNVADEKKKEKNEETHAHIKKDPDEEAANEDVANDTSSDKQPTKESTEKSALTTSEKTPEKTTSTTASVSSTQESKKTTPEKDQLPKPAQKNIHGGNILHRTEDKPERILHATVTPSSVSRNNTPIRPTNTPAGAKKKSAVIINAITSKVKKTAQTLNSTSKAHFSEQLNAQRPTKQSLPEQKTPKPQKTIAEKQADKTRAPKIEHKPMPAYPLGNEDYDFPSDLGYVLGPDEPMDRGADVTGNPYARSGNPNAEPYEPHQPYQPSRYQPSEYPETGENDDAGGGNGGGGHNPFKIPHSPRMPNIRGGGLASKGSNAAAKEADKKLLLTVGRTPWGAVALIAIGIIIFLILFVLFLIFGFKSEDEKAKRAQQNAVQDTLIITKEVLIPLLPKYTVGQRITFKITVTDTKPAQEITIIDYVPEGVSLLETDVTSSWTKRIYDPVKKTITFKASENVTPAQLTPPNFNFTVTYLITQPYKQYYGGVEANAIASASGTQVGYIPPTDSDCGGKYSSDITKNRFLKKNFGDPLCDPSLNKAKIDTLIQQKDSANAAWWFQVAKCESGYRVNAWRDPDTIRHTPDAGGAWGLMQVGSSIIATPESLYSNSQGRGSVQLQNLKQLPGLPGGTWGHGGEFDRGDVNWEIQIDNAIKLLDKRGKGYWACA